MRVLFALSAGALLIAIVSVAINVEGYAISLAIRYVWARHLLSAGPGFAFLGLGLGWFAYLEYRDADEAAMRASEALTGLEASERRYRRLVDLSPYAIYVQTDGRFVFANRAAGELFRVGSPDDLIGTSVLDRVSPELRDLAEDRMGRFRGTSSEMDPTREVKSRFVRMDGSIADVEMVLAKTAFDGQPAVQVIVRDMTAHLREGKELERYRLLAESAGDIVFFIRKDGRVLDANRAAEHAYGYTRDELLEMDVERLRDPECLAPLHAQLESALRGGASASRPAMCARTAPNSTSRSTRNRPSSMVSGSL
jgi:PAS domain S-box-containing protein